MALSGTQINQNPWGSNGVINKQKPSGTPQLPTKVDVDSYEYGPGYGYDVQTLSRPGQLMNQSFDPYRQNASRDVNAATQSNFQTGSTSLASSGGLSSADQMALKAQQQRANVSGQQGAQGLYDQMQAQNSYDTQKFNVGQQQGVSDYNSQILNQRARDMSTEANKKAENLYNQRMKDALLDRQLEAAKLISQQQR